MSGFFGRFIKLSFGTLAAAAVAVKPRTSQKPDLSQIERYDYANGGYAHNEAFCGPNTLDAYRRAVEYGYGIVMDVKLRRDGSEIVVGTSELPDSVTLAQALEAVGGAVPVILRLHKEKQRYVFCERLFETLDAYDGVFAVASADPKMLRQLRERRDAYVRVQISEITAAADATFRGFLRSLAVRNLLLNIWTAPDMVLCGVSQRNRPGVFLCRTIYRIPVICGIVRDMREYETVKTDGGLVLFEGMEP